MRKNPHSGLSPERGAFVSGFLRRKGSAKEVHGGMTNAKKGVKYALTARRWRLWQKLAAEMKVKIMKPVSWSFFWALTLTAQYVLLKYDTCCCGICRLLGFDNYDELREITNELNSEIRRQTNDERGLPRLAQLHSRVDKVEEFRRGTYLTHLHNDSSCGLHCLRMPLSAHNNPAFRSPCQHEGPESGAGEVTRAMEQLVRDALDRKTKKSDGTTQPAVRVRDSLLAPRPLTPKAFTKLLPSERFADCSTLRVRSSCKSTRGPSDATTTTCATWKMYLQ